MHPLRRKGSLLVLLLVLVLRLLVEVWSHKKAPRWGQREWRLGRRRHLLPASSGTRGGVALLLLLALEAVQLMRDAVAIATGERSRD